MCFRSCNSFLFSYTCSSFDFIFGKEATISAEGSNLFDNFNLNRNSSETGHNEGHKVSNMHRHNNT